MSPIAPFEPFEIGKLDAVGDVSVGTVGVTLPVVTTPPPPLFDVLKRLLVLLEDPPKPGVNGGFPMGVVGAGLFGLDGVGFAAGAGAVVGGGGGFVDGGGGFAGGGVGFAGEGDGGLAGAVAGGGGGLAGGGAGAGGIGALSGIPFLLQLLTKLVSAVRASCELWPAAASPMTQQFTQS